MYMYMYAMVWLYKQVHILQLESTAFGELAYSGFTCNSWDLQYSAW